MELELFAHSEVLAPFFFLIGMQLRNEISHPKEILLPTLAALGGMLFPALIFISLNSDPLIAQGWPLVMPTDIALVMLVVLALGKRASVSLKTFLLALAVADDLLSIIVLGVKYTGALKATEVLASIGAVLLGALIGAGVFVPGSAVVADEGKSQCGRVTGGEGVAESEVDEVGIVDDLVPDFMALGLFHIANKVAIRVQPSVRDRGEPL